MMILREVQDAALAKYNNAVLAAHGTFSNHVDQAKLYLKLRIEYYTEILYYIYCDQGIEDMCKHFNTTLAQRDEGTGYIVRDAMMEDVNCPLSQEDKLFLAMWEI